MKLYKFSYILYEPEESTEPDKYMAEIPAIQGCRVWGDTPEETLDILQDIASKMIEMNIEYGWELPDEVKAALVEHDPAKEILVAV